MERGFDGNKLYDAIDLLENGPGRAEALLGAITQADKAGDSYWRMFFRFEYISEQYFHGEAVKCIPAVAEAEAVYKENPKAITRYKGDTLCKEAYIMSVLLSADTISCLPQVPLIQWKDMLDNFYRLSKKSGMAERCYYWQMFWHWRCIDFKQAEDYLKMAWNTKMDDRFGCVACEHAYAAGFYLETGQKGMAYMYAGKLEKHIMHTSCDNALPYLWAAYSKEALDRGAVNEALPFAKKLYKNCNKDKRDLEYIGIVLRCFAYGNINKALQIFIKWSGYATDTWNQRAKYYFYMGSWVLFRELSKKQDIVNLKPTENQGFWRKDGKYGTQALADWFYKETLEIAKNFDKRNGSNYYSGHLSFA